MPSHDLIPGGMKGQTTNSCLISTLGALAYFNRYRTDEEIVHHQAELPCLVELADTAFTTKGGGSGFSPEQAMALINKKGSPLAEHVKSFLHLQEPAYRLQLPAPATRDTLETQLRDLITTFKDLGDPTALQFFLEQHGVADTETIFDDKNFGKLFEMDSVDMYTRFLLKIRQVSGNAPASMTVAEAANQLCMVAGEYPKAFTVLGDGHYCALTLYSDRKAALYNSTSGRVATGTPTEILNDLNGVLGSSWQVQRVGVIPQVAARELPVEATLAARQEMTEVRKKVVAPAPVIMNKENILLAKALLEAYITENEKDNKAAIRSKQQASREQQKVIVNVGVAAGLLADMNVEIPFSLSHLVNPAVVGTRITSLIQGGHLNKLTAREPLDPELLNILDIIRNLQDEPIQQARSSPH